VRIAGFRVASPSPVLMSAYDICETDILHRPRALVVLHIHALATMARASHSALRIAGRMMRGPAVITEYSATTVIPPGKKFWLDASENLVITVTKIK